MEAAKALGEMGPVVVPTLIEVLRDENKSLQGENDRAFGLVTEVLVEIGPAAVSALVEKLADRDADWPTREASAYVLGEIGPGAQEAVPALI